MLSIDLRGKRALIAGVADDGGFGWAIGKALVEAGALKSYEPGTWHVSQLLSTPGYPTSANDSVVDKACQVNLTVRFEPPWMAWTNAVESADQPLLVRAGLWHHEQVAPSLRWPA